MPYRQYDHPSIALARSLTGPLTVFFGLFIAAAINQRPFTSNLLILGILAFLLSGELFDRFPLFCTRSEHKTCSQKNQRVHLLTAWGLTLTLLGLLGMVTQTIALFPPPLVITWGLLVLIFLLAGHAYLNYQIETLRCTQYIRKAIIVGANPLGYQLATRIHQQRNLLIQVEAFFDDRRDARSEPALLDVITGNFCDVIHYVNQFSIDLVFIALPVMDNPRIVNLVNSLRNSTASIYFVPDIFIFDLVQPHLDSMNGIPVIGILESPVLGINAVHKRVFDVVMALIMLIFVSPVLVVVSIGVKLSSPGPVFFKQRRYGIDGKEIFVYKFRSMRGTENDGCVIQAKRNDARVTPFGAFMRRTSIDELPQLINVIKGEMSIVGPRPHAIAHNEHYRKLIEGYMWRHKVKPGITGLAQINGFRGETDTLEKMQGRVDHDIAYLKNWSLWLDMKIVLKTIKLVLYDRNAY